MTSHWQPFQEPFRTTALRTGLIAIIAGAVLAARWGGLQRWPVATLLVLWLSFGGHWVELWFLNFLRPRLPVTRSVQISARLAVWFIGGIILGLGMCLTAMALAGLEPAKWPHWWIAGLGFIGIELLVHLTLLMRKRPNFYDGRA